MLTDIFEVATIYVLRYTGLAIAGFLAGQLIGSYLSKRHAKTYVHVWPN